MRNIVTYETRKSKQEYLKNYFEKNKNDTSLIWKGIRQLIMLKHKNKRQPSIITVKGNNVTNPKNIANDFNNFFTNIGPGLSKTNLQSKKNFTNFLNNSSFNSFVLKPITHDEVRKLVSQLNKRKALGPTSISVTIFKGNIDVLVTLILNQSFEQGISTEFIKIAQVSPIHKKEDTVTVSNYRPICSLSVFSKIFEKAMYYRIYSFLCKYKLIHTNQFCFRSNHSTEHALISLIETIKKCLDNDEIVCGVFIELQKAFDTINHEILLKKLDHYGIRSRENNWFRSFLTNRKQYVSLSSCFSQTKIARCGVPQGSTLGPLLFLI